MDRTNFFFLQLKEAPVEERLQLCRDILVKFDETRPTLLEKEVAMLKVIGSGRRGVIGDGGLGALGNSEPLMLGNSFGRSNRPNLRNIERDVLLKRLVKAEFRHLRTLNAQNNT